VPLSRQALTLLDELRQLTGGRRHLFASNRKRDAHIDQTVLNRALTRIGFGGERHVAHGFRSTFSSTANGSGKWSEDAIELQLAHIDKNKVRRVYNRNERWDERVALMTWWADRLDEMSKAACKPPQAMR